MSRSRKKHPVVKDYSRNYTKFAKRVASKIVRRYPHKIADGKAYRKVYCSWNIHDHRYSSYWMDGEEKKYWTEMFKRK